MTRNLVDAIWPAWMRRAACGGMDPTSWVTPAKGDRAFAMEVCRSCMVRRDCLDYAIEHEMRQGIWGATTAAQRRQMKATA